MAKALLFLLKMVFLTAAFFACFAFASTAAGLPGDSSGDTVRALIVVCALYTIVLSYPIIRSRWSGLALISTIFFVVFGIMTFLSQIETIVFLDNLVQIIDPGMIPQLFVQGAIIAALFAPLAVLVHGKLVGRDEYWPAPNNRLVMPAGEWVWKLILIALVYIAIYVGFGMFVFRPLVGPAFDEYYAGLQMPWWILPFQAGRAWIWTALALPVIRMMKGPWWEAGLAVSLLYAVLMGALLIMPADFMPETIRIGHMVEILSSNFVFGWIVVWVFHRQHGSLGGLLRGAPVRRW